jgi:large subunit ribosomal protein L19
MHLIQTLEKELGKKRLPAVHVGDTVEVHYLIKEGEKERVQLFIGTVISLKGRGIRRTVTVRRIVQGEGVERTFPLHSPRVKDVVTSRRGETRRSKLYFLRDRVGKSTRLKELLGNRLHKGGESDEAADEGGSADTSAPSGARESEQPVGV